MLSIMPLDMLRSLIRPYSQSSIKCEFKEKPFENIMNLELFNSRAFFSIDQVDEAVLGFDASGFTTHETFWRRFSDWRFRPPGVIPNARFWNLIEEEINYRFPNFRCNVFLQYKIPNYIFRGRESKYWDHKPYFRYIIDEDQQAILQTLETNVTANSLVLYASPAFWTWKQFQDFQDNQAFVENTNFTQPNRLVNHSKYTFINAGTNGKAYSKPEEIEVINFYKELKDLFNKSESFANNKQFIHALANSIKTLLPQLDKLYDLDTRDIIEKTDWYNPLAKSFGIIRLFTFVTGISWLVVSEKSLEYRP